MTDQMRPRRSGGTGDPSGPFEIDAAKCAAFFASGDPTGCWHALLDIFANRCWREFRKYKLTHPDAVPPNGYSWLDGPPPPPDPPIP